MDFQIHESEVAAIHSHKWRYLSFSSLYLIDAYHKLSRLKEKNTIFHSFSISSLPLSTWNGSRIRYPFILDVTLSPTPPLHFETAGNSSSNLRLIPGWRQKPQGASYTSGVTGYAPFTDGPFFRCRLSVDLMKFFRRTEISSLGKKLAIYSTTKVHMTWTWENIPRFFQTPRQESGTTRISGKVYGSIL